MEDTKMTVNELIEELQQLDGDLEVRMQTESGDYWRTTLATKVDGVRMAAVKWSEYHRCSEVAEDEYGEPDKDSTPVVLLEARKG